MNNCGHQPRSDIGDEFDSEREQVVDAIMGQINDVGTLADGCHIYDRVIAPLLAAKDVQIAALQEPRR